MNYIKAIIIGLVAVILISLGITVAIQQSKINTLQDNYSYAVANEKALLMQNDSNMNKVRSLRLSVEQLEYFNDSILRKLTEAKQQLKIKDKNLKELQYLKTLTTVSDTIYIPDTIFVEQFCLDTVVGDEWYDTHLKLCYPNEIQVTSEFESEKSIITSIRKEPIKPPCKTWIGRLFQKKHKVLEVEIIESNPYVITKEYKHIEIIK